MIGGNSKRMRMRFSEIDSKTASPAETPSLIIQLIDNLKYRLESAKSEEEKLVAILDTHKRFTRYLTVMDGQGHGIQLFPASKWISAVSYRKRD